MLESFFTDEGEDCLADRSTTEDSWGCSSAGIALKAWGNGDNSSELSVLPAGWYDSQVAYRIFRTANEWTHFWTPSEDFSIFVVRQLNSSKDGVRRIKRSKADAMSVRCVQ